ncbi:glucose 1-dehydrogenase [Dongia deserti]|uniref:glucose 1-dehydrogenase n=1 Tax=Dongia deserti TaxID=2268030 RepID=UPI000E6484D9|nr:glucose 1-dehydrogenase [Dongia deserti]
MRALAVVPHQPGSLALTEFNAPVPGENQLLARTLAIGVCGTDHEIIDGKYGEAPEGTEHLIIGHESLAEVVSAPTGSGFSAGDLIVGIVRRPDPVPCPNCAAGEWDMCRNGLYTEHGIKGAQGYAAEYFAIDPGYAVKVDRGLRDTGVLLEPTSIVAKAWDHIERIATRAIWKPRTVLVTGAGPVGLLAAMMGLQRGLDVTLFDRVDTGIKPKLAERLGARYRVGDLARIDPRPDVVIECTGAPSIVIAALEITSPVGIVCLAGISSGQRTVQIDGDVLGRTMVLENDVVFGTVNANRRHYAMAADALAAADQGWLRMMITRRVPLSSWAEAFKRGGDDVKIVIDFAMG